MAQRRHRRNVGSAFHPIDAPEFFAGTVDEGEACGLGTSVSLREGDLGAGGLELGRHALATLAVPIAECHARALGDETPDRRLADPPPVTTATLPSSLPCSPPFIALRNAHPRSVVSIRRPPPCWPGLGVRPSPAAEASGSRLRPCGLRSTSSYRVSSYALTMKEIDIIETR
jgi:hypothetical protein